MTTRDRERLERALERRRADLERWSSPVNYELPGFELAPVVDKIQARIQKANVARAEIVELEARLNGGRR